MLRKALFSLAAAALVCGAVHTPAQAKSYNAVTNLSQVQVQGRQLFLRPQAAENGVPAGVVGRLAELLQGQHRRRSQQEGEAQIQPQKQGQQLVAHQVLVDHQPAVDPDHIL